MYTHQHSTKLAPGQTFLDTIAPAELTDTIPLDPPADVDAWHGYYPGDTFLVRYGSKIVECTLLYTISIKTARVSYNRWGAEFHADVTSSMLAVKS